MSRRFIDAMLEWHFLPLRRTRILCLVVASYHETPAMVAIRADRRGA